MPAPRRMAKARSLRLRKWAVGCVAFAMVLLLACLGSYRVWGGDPTALDRQLDRTEIGIQNARLSVRTMRGELGAAQRRLVLNRAVGRQTDWSVMMALLARTLEDDIVLKRCRLELQAFEQPKPDAPGRGRSGPMAPSPPAGTGLFVVRLSGLGRTQASVSQFLLRLEKTGLFDKVTLIKTGREPFLTEQAVAFELDCEIDREDGKAQ